MPVTLAPYDKGRTMGEQVMTGAPDLSRLNDDELLETITRLEQQNEKLADQLEESMARITLAIDDIGWKPLNVLQTEEELSLDTLKKAAETCRALVTINPLVKRGIAVRTSYIWGKGVKMSAGGGDAWRTRSVERTLGTTLAQLELERTAASDGNLIFLVDQANGTIQRLPFHQMSGTVTAEDDTERALYYKRTYTKRVSNLIDYDVNVPSNQVEHVWYPSDELEGTPVARIGDVKVDRTKRIVHVAFNRQVGWVWGVPDVFAVVFWTEAYKTFLENCATLARAYARFAWKVTSDSKKGQQRVANKMATAPTRDPATGRVADVGAAIALGSNQDMSALQTVRPVDFSAGQPLAAMIAAGLEIPLPMLTSDPGSGNRATAETLDTPTNTAMEARQQLMDDAIKRVFTALGVPNVELDWPPVSEDPLHRLIQAYDMAGRTGVLFPREWRELILKAVKLETTTIEPPTEDELPLAVKNQMAPPAQPDPMSRGDHELRDEGTQAHVDEA